ncbi:hypothetical protein WH96_20765, partial [Kiloniella spongiae]
AQTSSTTTVAGSLEGEFAVDDSGAAIYSLPISVPPGIAGNEPRLALSYSSQAGNGPLGVGWGLSGLSAITRCGQRLVPHGKIHGVDFSTEDRFCLDGQRLVAVSGDYGADGTEYRTEIESYAKVISNGTAGTGPASFTVWSKGGLVLEYGVTADSRIEAIKADGTARSEARIWALNKQSDRSNNAITYSYIEDQANGSYRINRIDYGGNTTVGTTATSSVRFVYEDRTDIRTWYQAGAKVTQDKRLANIQTYEAERVVSNYRLTYEYNSTENQSRIIQVQMCDVGGNCLSSISVNWPAINIGFSSLDTGDNLTSSVDWGKGYWSFNGDVNGDGFSDVISVLRTTSYLKVATFRAKGDGKFHDHDTSLDYTYSNNWVENSPLIGDVDGDGLSDVTMASFTTAGIRAITLRSRGDGGFYPLEWDKYLSVSGDWSQGYQPMMADVNGDGLSDLVAVKAASNGLSITALISKGDGSFLNYDSSKNYGEGGNWTNQGSFPKPIIGDVDADGLSDVVLVYDSPFGLSIYNFRSNGDGSFTKGIKLREEGNWLGGGSMNVSDVNGDGLDDVIMVWNSSNSLSVANILSHGDGRFGAYDPKNTYLDLTDWSGDYDVIPADLNGDELVDLVLAKLTSNGWLVSQFLANGKGSFVPMGTVATSGDWSDRDAQFLGDVDGDGMSDLVAVKTRYTGMSISNLKSKSQPKVISSFSTSRGSFMELTYTPLTDKLVYSKGSDAVYPEQDYVSPLSVVQSVERDDGIGGKRKIEYNYAGAKVDLKRGSFLGFKQITSKDIQRGTETITDYRQDWPFVRRTEKSVRQLVDGTPISEQENTWEQVPQTGGSIDVRLKSQTNKQYEINTTTVTP